MITNEITLLNAKAATGIGGQMDVSDYDNVVLSVGTASSANLTVKFAGATSATTPDVTAAQTVANMYDFIDVTDMQSQASIDGDTGLAPIGTDDFRLFRVDVRGLKWLIPVVTARSAGSVTVKAIGQRSSGL